MHHFNAGEQLLDFATTGEAGERRIIFVIINVVVSNNTSRKPLGVAVRDADTKRECSEGIYQPSCEWASDIGKCVAIDSIALPAKCKKIIFYNRVPKTGSAAMTAAMDVAAERSEGVLAQPEDLWKQYQWFGYTFKGRYVLNAAYRWNKPQKDEEVEGYCKFFTKLGTQAPRGVRAALSVFGFPYDLPGCHVPTIEHYLRVHRPTA